MDSFSLDDPTLIALVGGVPWLVFIGIDIWLSILAKRRRFPVAGNWLLFGSLLNVFQFFVSFSSSYFLAYDTLGTVGYLLLNNVVGYIGRALFVYGIYLLIVGERARDYRTDVLDGGL